MPRKKKIIDEEKVFLTDKEINVFDIHHEKEKARKLNLENLNLAKELLLSKKSYHQLQLLLIEKEMQLLLSKEDNYKKSVKLDREAHKQWVNELKLKYDIETDNFGFDPDTGEVVI